jgi:hypothetical protein
VTILALLAWLQAIIAGYHTLQFLHVLPLTWGPMSFFGFDLLGAVLWGVTTVIYVWAALMLWRLDERGWIFAVLMAGWILVMDVLEALGATSLLAVLPSMIASGAVLIYGVLPSTREAFSSQGLRSTG